VPRFLGLAEGVSAPLLYANDQVVRPESGEQVGGTEIKSAWVGSDGVVTALLKDKKSWDARSLVRLKPGEGKAKPRDLPEDLTEPALYGGFLVGLVRRSGEAHLAAAQVGPEGLGPIQELGSGSLQRKCRTPEATFLATHSHLSIFT